MASCYRFRHTNAASDTTPAQWKQSLCFSGTMYNLCLVINTLKEAKHLKPSIYMYRRLKDWRIPRSFHTVNLCVLFESQNKQWRFPYTAWTGWFLGSFAILRTATTGFVVSVCPSVWNNSARTGQNFIKFDTWRFCENLSRKLNFHHNLPRITGTLQKNQYTFLFISLSVLLRMRNVSNKLCRENQNTHFMFNNVCLFENRAVYEIMWENTVDPDGQQTTIWQSHCRLDTYDDKPALRTCNAFKLQQWLHERASMLCYNRDW
jgi:hypothetical protein